MTTALTHTTVGVLAHETGLHPDLVRRLLRLGAIEPEAVDAAARLARIVRLRRDLGLNYAGAILAVELLARIERLEARQPWTRTA
jgi:hypothetical protein